MNYRVRRNGDHMGRWAQRHRRGAAPPPGAPSVVSVTIDGGDPTIAIVLFNMPVVSATPGAGDLENLVTADDGQIMSQVDALRVRYGIFSSGLTVGDPWQLGNPSGLVFAGGVVMTAVQNGAIV